jgi:hypothetical protein
MRGSCLFRCIGGLTWKCSLKRLAWSKKKSAPSFLLFIIFNFGTHVVSYKHCKSHETGAQAGSHHSTRTAAISNHTASAGSFIFASMMIPTLESDALERIIVQYFQYSVLNMCRVPHRVWSSLSLGKRCSMSNSDCRLLIPCHVI